jgi:hypothetical protein
MTPGRRAAAGIADRFVLLGAVANNIASGRKSSAGSITTLESELRRMPIASECWITCKQSSYGPFSMTWDIGYSCLDGRWGIALRVVRWNAADPGERSVESWPFEQSPPYLRRRTITQLPALLHALAGSGRMGR